MWTRALAGADASCGGKARGLARLIEAGLRVPDGFVIDHRAFRVATGDVVRTADETTAILDPDPGISLRLRPEGVDGIGHELHEIANQVMTCELPADLIAEVDAQTHTLGGPFAVRSSATIEDGEAGAAAGVFSSGSAVSIEELWQAIRFVWTSALTPLAAAYARRRSSDIAISVIVQRFVEGELVTVYTRPPGQPDADEMWLQRAGMLHKLPRNEGPPALEAEIALGVSTGVDVEMIVPRIAGAAEHALADLDFANAWFVQARPIVHPVFAVRSAPPPMVIAPLQDGRRWTLDLAHNPDPLSTAQADLVDRVERAGAAPWSARVSAGYLYTAPRDQVRVAPPATAEELLDRATRIEQRLAAALDARASGAYDLATVIDRYVGFYRIWANELGPLIAVSRGQEPPPVGARPHAVESWLLAAARGDRASESVTDLLSVLAPAWDVATPTFGEHPRMVRHAIARTRALIGTPPALTTAVLPDPPDPSIATVEYFEFRAAMAGPQQAGSVESLAADLAERDDFFFAIAQWTVRRAVLERTDALGIAREDAFWIPLDDLIAGIDPVEAGRRASGARAAATRATSWNMPIVVDPDSSTRNSGVALVGIGSGHRLSGRVRRFESLASAIVVGRGDIVVTRAVTPALAVIVIGCAAIISETGGVLDHGAAMARELGIPCIVGCRDAWSLLADGMIITVDGDHVTITH